MCRYKPLPFDSVHRVDRYVNNKTPLLGSPQCCCLQAWGTLYVGPLRSIHSQSLGTISALTEMKVTPENRTGPRVMAGGKGKAVPLQAWSPEASRKLRFPEFMTTAQDGGKVSLTHRPPLSTGNAPGTHFC